MVKAVFGGVLILNVPVPVLIFDVLLFGCRYLVGLRTGYFLDG